MSATIAVSALGPSAAVTLGTLRAQIRADRNLRVAGLYGLSNSASTGQVGVRTDSAGALVGTAALEVTMDGTNWIPSAYGALGDDQYAMIPETEAVAVRANASAYTSGTLTLTLLAFR